MVVTMDEDGNVIKYDVKEWVERDKKIYLEKLKEAQSKS